MDCNTPEHTCKNAYWFLFYNDELLVKENTKIPSITLIRDVKILNFKPTSIQYIGLLNGNKCYAANIANENIPKGFSFKKLILLYGQLADQHFWFAGRAFHMMSWLKSNKFCSCCGNSMNVLTQEFAAKCSHCGHIVYPRISPAIIVAVVKDDKLLLVRSRGLPPGMYSVIAGFVEPGETLEACVKRELQEEVGIEVTNISYFGNQPWPFPDSLMIAFTAQYAAGKITIDHEEIVDAGWFGASELPDIPPKGIIARQLVDWFVDYIK